MKKNYILFKYFIMTFLFLFIIMTSSKNAFAQSNTNTTLAKATPINIGSTVNGTFNGNNNEIYYYKITIPKDIGNQYITFSLTDYSSSRKNLDLCDETNQTIDYVGFIGTNEN